LIERYPPEQTNPFESLQGLSSRHWFGTDPSGFDIFSRVVSAARLDLVIAMFGTAIAVGLGAAIGMAIGFGGGGLVSSTVSRCFDLIQSFPIFILALMIVALFGQRVSNIVFAIAVVYTPFYVRLFRSQT